MSRTASSTNTKASTISAAAAAASVTAAHVHTSAPNAERQAEFNEYMLRLQRRFDTTTATQDNLFVANVGPILHQMGVRPGGMTDPRGLTADGVQGAPTLYDYYLSTFPIEWRQYHTCSECRKFINSYGSLAIVLPNGQLKSALWSEYDAPDHYKPVAAAFERLIPKCEISDVFKTDHKMWGTAKTGVWTHFAVKPHYRFVFSSKTKTPFQAAANIKHRYQTMSRALSEFDAGLLQKAKTIIESDVLRGNEKVTGPINFLADLRYTLDQVKSQRERRNILWRAVASAPEGFCHPRASLVGSLLADLESGVPIAQVKASFEQKVAPDKYKRPQAAPTDGNIKRAEELIAKLGLAPSLERRFARLEDIQQMLWSPTIPEPESEYQGGVFGHLKSKQKNEPKTAELLPTVNMTWARFQAQVLPQAKRIAVEITYNRQPFTAFMTAVYPDAPPIIQWDRPECRNPVSWYVYVEGSTPDIWNLRPGWVDVTGVAYAPHMWDDLNEYPQHQKSVTFFLDGMYDRQAERGQTGLGLFPDFLHAELHEVRSTIEAHSNSKSPTGAAEATACGFMFSDGPSPHPMVVIIDDGSMVKRRIKIDRWD
jgi:hypothetical protein